MPGCKAIFEPPINVETLALYIAHCAVFDNTQVGIKTYDDIQNNALKIIEDPSDL